LHHFALDGLYILIGLKVRRENGTVEDVVFEDALELLDVFGVEKVLEGVSTKRGKGSVGGSKDSEGAFGREGLRELAGGNGGDEGG
jgi:hypothetical protein